MKIQSYTTSCFCGFIYRLRGRRRASVADRPRDSHPVRGLHIIDPDEDDQLLQRQFPGHERQRLGNGRRSVVVVERGLGRPVVEIAVQVLETESFLPCCCGTVHLRLQHNESSVGLNVFLFRTYLYCRSSVGVPFWPRCTRATGTSRCPEH